MRKANTQPVEGSQIDMGVKIRGNRHDIQRSYTTPTLIRGPGMDWSHEASTQSLQLITL